MDEGFFGKFRKALSRPDDPSGVNEKPTSPEDDAVIAARRNFLKGVAGAGAAAMTGGAPQAASVLAQTLAAAGAPLSQKAFEKLPEVAQGDAVRGLRGLIGRFTDAYKRDNWNPRSADVAKTLASGRLPVREDVFDRDILSKLGGKWERIFENLPPEWKVQDVMDGSFEEALKAVTGEGLSPDVKDNIGKAMEHINQIFGTDTNSTFAEIREKYDQKVMDIVKDASRPENKALWGKDAWERKHFLDDLGERVPRRDGAVEVFQHIRTEADAAQAQFDKDIEAEMEQEDVERRERVKEGFSERQKARVYLSLAEVKAPLSKTDPTGATVFEIEPRIEGGGKIRELKDIDVFQFLQTYMPFVMPAMVDIQHGAKHVRLVSKDKMVTTILRELIVQAKEGEISLAFPDRVTDQPLHEL